MAGGSGARQPYAPDQFVFAGPVWLKLLRKGDTFYGYYSKDGVDWIRSGYWHYPDAHTIAFDEPFYVGMCLTSHANGITTTAVFGDFSFAAIATILRSGNLIRPDWRPFGVGEYRVQYTDDLLNETWLDAPNMPISSTFWLENIAEVPRRFYRIASP